MTVVRRLGDLGERGPTPSPRTPAARRAHGTLVMLRHGRTSWNDESRFTGWADPELSDRGEVEARRAGDALAVVSLDLSLVLTSAATRARETAALAVRAGEGVRFDWRVDWRLNERHFGLLQGMDRASAVARYGRDAVRHWKRDRDALPPAIPEDDERHPRHDGRYLDVARESLPGAETIADHERRVLACWGDTIAPRLAGGEDVLVVGHCHTLRALARLASAPRACATDSLFKDTGSALMTSEPGVFVELTRD